MNQSSTKIITCWFLLLWSSVIDATAAFSPQFISHQTASLCTGSSFGRKGSKKVCQRIQNPALTSYANIRSYVASSAKDGQRDQDTGLPHHETYQYSCDVSKEVGLHTQRDKSLLRRFLSKSKASEGEEEQKQQRFRFPYDTNILELTGNEAARTATTGIILIHPIGVGIGKWFYNRLLESIYEQYYLRRESDNSKNYVVAVPDLLGSGTACNPSLRASSSSSSSSSHNEFKKLPLLTVQDWSTQICQLMVNLEADFPRIDNWCIVANGGCSPIALQVAQESVDAGSRCSFKRPVTNVVLSSVPRLPFFLPEKDDDEARRTRLQRVQKAYKFYLGGILGRLFWWYALRRNGKFIRKFSEKNLVADPKNLGEDWVPNCVATARMYNGKSRYSTFSFLAGSLQAEGCRDSLDALRRHSNDVKVDLIRGRDRRRNQAKSWFWQKPKQNQPAAAAEQRETLQQVLERNGNRAKVLESGGRVSLAYEDAPGYANALFEFLK